jgi:hypothetical protein
MPGQVLGIGGVMADPTVPASGQLAECFTGIGFLGAGAPGGVAESRQSIQHQTAQKRRPAR